MTSPTHSTETHAGTTWQLDAAHANIEFAVRHLMISTVRGRFGDVSGSISVDPARPTKPEGTIQIKAASVDTRQDQRDTHLRSADFLDAASFPAITFASRRIEGKTAGDFKLIGDLTIRGVSREVVLDVTSQGVMNDPWGNERAGYSATTKISRHDFGLTWNQVLEAGGVAVGDEVKISIDVEFTRPLAAASEALVGAGAA